MEGVGMGSLFARGSQFSNQTVFFGLNIPQNFAAEEEKNIKNHHFF